MYKFNPVDQEIVDKGYGDCLRACYASLLGLPIDAVPNFIRHEQRWFLVLNQFLWTCGWNFAGTGWWYRDRPRTPRYEESIRGFLKASVDSRVYKGGSHAVIINCNGLVVHDPSPYKLHQGVNVIQTGELHGFDLMERRTDSEWLRWGKKKK